MYFNNSIFIIYLLLLSFPSSDSVSGIFGWLSSDDEIFLISVLNGSNVTVIWYGVGLIKWSNNSLFCPKTNGSHFLIEIFGMW